MKEYVWLGYDSEVLNNAENDDMYNSFRDDCRIFINDDIWIFCQREDLQSLKNDFPNMISTVKTVAEWILHATKDYWDHSMEEIEFIELVDENDFEKTMLNKVKNITKSKIESLRVDQLTETVLKKLIIKELKGKIRVLLTEIE